MPAPVKVMAVIVPPVWLMPPLMLGAPFRLLSDTVAPVIGPVSTMYTGWPPGSEVTCPAEDSVTLPAPPLAMTVPLTVKPVPVWNARSPEVVENPAKLAMKLPVASIASEPAWPVNVPTASSAPTFCVTGPAVCRANVVGPVALKPAGPRSTVSAPLPILTVPVGAPALPTAAPSCNVPVVV